MRQDRRKHSRIGEPVQVVVRGPAGRGRHYQFKTTAKNVGAGGLCAFAPRTMEAGEKVTLLVRFALSEDGRQQAPSIAARAVVARVEGNRDGSCIFAASFLQYRFI